MKPTKRRKEHASPHSGAGTLSRHLNTSQYVPVERVNEKKKENHKKERATAASQTKEDIGGEKMYWPGRVPAPGRRTFVGGIQSSANARGTSRTTCLLLRMPSRHLGVFVAPSSTTCLTTLNSLRLTLSRHRRRAGTREPATCYNSEQSLYRRCTYRAYILVCFVCAPV